MDSLVLENTTVAGIELALELETQDDKQEQECGVACMLAAQVLERAGAGRPAALEHCNSRVSVRFWWCGGI